MPLLNAFRQRIGAGDMVAELNYYYDKSTGIGFHGDAERHKVICLRLGDPMPLHFQWFQRSRPVGERTIIELNAGDVYIMSEKAVGRDWRKSSIMTLRHAAGHHKKYMPTNEEIIKKKQNKNRNKK